MRGTPNNPIICVGCGEKKACRDGLCNPCRTKGRRKHIWTPALDDQLRQIYADNASNRMQLSKALRAFKLRSGFPRVTISSRAMQLRITVGTRHPWTREHDCLLQQMAGKRSLEFMANTLHRSIVSIHSRLVILKLSYRYTEGYSRIELRSVFGASQRAIERWINRGWIKFSRETDRASEEQVRKFLHAHPEEYDLRRVDQAWFKGMIFSSFGSNAHDRRDIAEYSIEEVA
jgi:hypothetical protein